MAARRAAVDAELVLNGQHLRVVEIEEIRRPAVGIQILFEHLETHPRRIPIALRTIVHRPRETL